MSESPGNSDDASLNAYPVSLLCYVNGYVWEIFTTFDPWVTFKMGGWRQAVFE